MEGLNYYQDIDLEIVDVILYYLVFYLIELILKNHGVIKEMARVTKYLEVNYLDDIFAPVFINRRYWIIICCNTVNIYIIKVSDCCLTYVNESLSTFIYKTLFEI